MHRMKFGAPPPSLFPSRGFGGCADAEARAARLPRRAAQCRAAPGQFGRPDDGAYPAPRKRDGGTEAREASLHNVARARCLLKGLPGLPGQPGLPGT